MKDMKLRVLIITVLVLFTTLTVIVYDAMNGALTRLEVQRVTLTSDKIPDAFNDLNLVYFSDLHDHTLNEAYYQKVVDSINAMNPDFVVFGGDLIDEASYADYSDAQRKAIIALLTSIKAPYGKFAILSQTDLAHQTELSTLYLEAGFEILNGKLIPVHVLGASSINFLGFDQDTPSTLLTGIQPDSYTIAFVHDPDLAVSLNGQGVNAVLAGKTHGGQVTLPIFGPMVSKDETYRRGHYALSQSDLYVSTGIGVSQLKARWMTDPSYILVTFKTK